MSRSHLSGAAVIVATLLLTVLIVTLVPVGSSVDSTQQLQTEKSKRMADPFGYPDLFNEVQRSIRTEDGQEPGYPMNYQMEELVKARQALKTTSTLIPWAERGPGNVSGRTRAIIIDPSDNDRETLFVGSVGGGVWLTRDKGDSWTSLTDHLPNLGVSAMAMSASNTDVIYFGTGEGFYSLDAVAGAGIFKSTDRGNEWTQLESTKNNFDFRYVNRLAIDPDDEDIVVVATNAGIFRTTDGGGSFDQVYPTYTKIQDLQVSPQDFSIQFATEFGIGVLKSEDGGQTWGMSLDEFVRGAARIEIGIAPSNPDFVYIAVWAGSTSDMYHTTDGGDTWSPMFQDNASGTPVDWMQGQGEHNNAIAVDPTDLETVYLGGIELWKSIQQSGVDEVTYPTSLDRTETDAFMSFVNFGAPYFHGILTTGNFEHQVDNVSDVDLVSVEVRFGPGRSQKAHRFTVSARGGHANDGGAGIPFEEYLYRDYVEVPFEVWEIDDSGNDANQMMVSFRDQADDGVWNLLHHAHSGPRDDQSRENYFINGYVYDENDPHADIAQDGGLTDKMLFFMWPELEASAEWDPEELPESALRITVGTFTGPLHAVGLFAGSATVHVDHHGIEAIAYGEGLAEMDIFNVNDGGVYYSEDKGLSWSNLGRGYNTSLFYGVDRRPDFGNSNIDQYIGGTQDNGTWMSDNQPTAKSDWLDQLGGDGFETVWHSQNDNNIIGSSQFNNFQRSTNRGTSWKPATKGIKDIHPFISTLGNSRDAPDILYTVGKKGVWRSTDFAANWSLIRIGADWGFTSTGKARVSLANPDVVWAGFRLDSGGKLHRSLDGGITFAPAYVPDIAVQAAISGLATHPHDDGTAYVLYSVHSAPKILRTTDHGDTWEDLSGFIDRNPVSTNGFPNVAVHDLLVMPGSPNILWAGTEIGIFVSSDYGDSWSYADNGLPAVSVWRMKIIDDVIILATHGRGIWTVDLDEVVAVSTESAAAELPGGFQLEQNYPNPFNPTTTITFSVPEPARVELAVFDVSGREMATLTDQVYQAGRHEMDWDAAHMASGVYFVRMKAGTKVQTRRMMLIK